MTKRTKQSTPITATEIRMRLQQEARQELLKWLSEANWKSQKIEVHLDHFDGGHLGTLTCEIIKWNPPI